MMDFLTGLSLVTLVFSMAVLVAVIKKGGR